MNKNFQYTPPNTTIDTQLFLSPKRKQSSAAEPRFQGIKNISLGPKEI